MLGIRDNTFWTYTSLIAILALLKFVTSLISTSEDAGRQLALPEVPDFSAGHFIEKQTAAELWQPAAHASAQINNPELLNSANEPQVRDEFVYQGISFQLLGIFNTAEPFAMLRLLNRDNPANSIATTAYRTGQQPGGLTITEITHNSVCLAGSEQRFCLNMFKSDRQIVKAN